MISYGKFKRTFNTFWKVLKLFLKLLTVSVALAQNIDQDHNKTTILFFVCICLACGNISQKRFIFDVWTRVGFVDVSVEMYRKRPSLVNYHCIVVKTSLYHDACVVIIHDMCSIWARIYWLVQRTFVTLLVVNTMLVPSLLTSSVLHGPVNTDLSKEHNRAPTY